jgi:hypothetical protein
MKAEIFYIIKQLTKLSNGCLVHLYDSSMRMAESCCDRKQVTGLNGYLPPGCQAACTEEAKASPHDSKSLVQYA